MLIDSHLHIGLNNWTEQSLIKYLDDNKIEKGWILTWDEYKPVADEYYIPLDIDIVKKAFRNHPDRIVPFYAPDPRRPDWKEKLSKCMDEGFAGCAELKVACRWDDPAMIALLDFVNERKLPLIFHMERGRNLFIPVKDRGLGWILKRLMNERYNGRASHLIESFTKNTGIFKKFIEQQLVYFPGYLLDLEALEKSITDFPDITFIGHGPHIWNHYSVPEKEYLFHQDEKPKGPGLLWRLLEQYENFYCDISGYSGFNAMNRDHAISNEFLSKYYNKILFGTDNMDLGLFELIESLGIEKNKLEQIYFRNADSIIG